MKPVKDRQKTVCLILAIGAANAAVAGICGPLSPWNLNAWIAIACVLAASFILTAE